MEIRSLTARAQNAERRAINLQNQLLQSEEKLTVVNQKTAAADTKWEARVKEYETRLKAAEEKVKREKQGGKERAQELDNQLKYVSVDPSPMVQNVLIIRHRSLQRQLELANKRTSTLNEIIESAGLSSKNSPNTSK